MTNKTSPRVSMPPLPSRRALPPFEALRAFDAVARLGGVRKAAQGLYRDHAVVSRHLRTIEEWTGATLLERTPGGTVLTEDGLRYHEKISSAIDSIASATMDLMKRSNDNVLYAWCMPGFAFQWLMGRLGDFENENPNLNLELRPTDGMPDLERHEADVDIRLAWNYGPPLHLPSSIRTIEIAHPDTIAVANPNYIAEELNIEHPRDLLEYQLIHEEDFAGWAAWLAAYGVNDELPLSGPRLWHAHLTLDAARRGRGVALTNRFVAASDLASGRLVDVGQAAGFKPVSLGPYLFAARADRWDALPVQRFREWLLKTVSEGGDN